MEKIKPFFLETRQNFKRKKNREKLVLKKPKEQNSRICFLVTLKQNPTIHKINMLFQGRQQHLQQGRDPNSTA